MQNAIGLLLVGIEMLLLFGFLFLFDFIRFLINSLVNGLHNFLLPSTREYERIRESKLKKISKTLSSSLLTFPISLERNNYRALDHCLLIWCLWCPPHRRNQCRRHPQHSLPPGAESMVVCTSACTPDSNRCHRRMHVILTLRLYTKYKRVRERKRECFRRVYLPISHTTQTFVHISL